MKSLNFKLAPLLLFVTIIVSAATLAQPCQTNFLLKFNGTFDRPAFPAIDPAGNVYVPDFQNNRIQKFDSNGNLLSIIGSLGNGNGQFNGPISIAFGLAGSFYVADYNNNRIQQFSAGGTFIQSWGGLGAGNGQFNNPYFVAVDALGNVYVTDLNNNRIQKFDSNGNFILSWGGLGNSNGRFNAPQGIAIDATGNVYVVDQNNNRVQKFDSQGNFISKWGAFGAGPGQFNGPSGISIDMLGNLYVADFFNDRIQKFDPNGNFILQWGSSGVNNGQFNHPYGIVVDSAGNVYVTELVNNRVQKFGCGALASASRCSDQKAGSLLVFPFYGSNGPLGDTRLTLTNVGPAGSGLFNQAAAVQRAIVHLFWLDESCSQADVFLCLTPFQSTSVKASDWDPVTKRGTMIAVAVDSSGYPIAYNGLVGNAFVSLTSAEGNRYIGNYGAEAFGAAGLAVSVGGMTNYYTSGANPITPATSATLNLNGAPAAGVAAGYDQAAVGFAAEFQSPVDAAGQTILMASLNGTIGSALTGAGQAGTGTIFRNDEKLFSFTGINSGCNSVTIISETFPRVVGGLRAQIPSGSSGTILWNSPGGAVGLFLTPVNSSGKVNSWYGIRSLHKRVFGKSALTIPIFAPDCGV